MTETWTAIPGTPAEQRRSGWPGAARAAEGDRMAVDKTPDRELIDRAAYLIADSQANCRLAAELMELCRRTRESSAAIRGDAWHPPGPNRFDRP